MPAAGKPDEEEYSDPRKLTARNRLIVWLHSLVWTVVRRLRFMTRIAFCTSALWLSLSWFAGCSHGPAEQKEVSSAKQPIVIYNVAVLGDASRNKLLAEIAVAHDATVNTSGSLTVADVGKEPRVFHFQTAAEDSASTHAGLVWGADLTLLAVDATQGPLPIHREHILVARQMAVPAVVIAFTRSGDIDDPELLELEELEMRELLNHYGLPGDAAPCIFDNQSARTTSAFEAPKGAIQIVDSLGVIAKKRIAPTVDREGKQFTASIYSLVPREAFRPDIAIPVKTGPVMALVGSEAVAAEITGPKEIATGETGEIEIVFANSIRVAEGQRFLLLNKEHVAAVGFFLPPHSGSR